MQAPAPSRPTTATVTAAENEWRSSAPFPAGRLFHGLLAMLPPVGGRPEGHTTPLDPPSPLEQRPKLLRRQLGRSIRVLEQRIRQLTFAPVQLDDALFDGALRDQTIDGDRACLPDAVG